MPLIEIFLSSSFTLYYFCIFLFLQGLQAISKRIKIFQYLKNYVISNGFIFLQETHSSVKDEKIWNDEFKGQLFFSHGKTNSCGVAIGLVGTKALKILNIKRDNLRRILVIEVKTDNSVPPGNKMSWWRHNDVFLYVPATSQVRLKWNTRHLSGTSPRHPLGTLWRGLKRT